MTRLLVASALLIPAVAMAQPVPEPTDPNEPTNPADQAPPAPQPDPSAAPVQPVPVPEPAPTVIVNPPPRATVISTEPQYETVQSPFNAPIFASGAITFAVSYGAAVITAASVDADDREQWAERLYVPVVGPWLALNDYGDCPITNEQCDDETTTKVLLVADGVLQAGGVIGMITGLLSPSYHTRPVRTSQDTKVRVRPTVGRGGNGLMVFGRF